MVNVTTGVLLVNGDTYIRAIGEATGISEAFLEGDESYNGRALFEEFKY